MNPFPSGSASLCALMISAVCAVALPRQDAKGAVVAVEVTSVAGESVYIDKGADANIEEGDRVLFYSADHGILTGKVASVTRAGARCTLDSGAVALRVGTRGEVLIPDGRGKPKQDEPRRPPDHPPWTAPPEEWNSDKPLLSPAFSRRPEERPTEIFGFAYGNYSMSRDESAADNRFTLGRVGASVVVVNPVDWGGVLRLRSDVLRRDDQLEFSEDVSETTARLDQLSYAYGGLRGQPWRVEAGRFLQHDFPELGTLDGAEGSYRTGPARFGGSLGLLPDPEHTLTAGDSAAVAAFGRFFAGEHDEFNLGLALEKTWTHGDPDRDLLIGVGEYTPSTHLFTRAALWLDYYTSSEVEKSPGFELTEAHLDLTWRLDPDHGFGAFYARVQTPDQKADELDPVLAREILENAVTRYGVLTWQRVSASLLLDARAERWEDQDGATGTAGEVRAAFQNILWAQGEIAVTFFVTDGIFSSGPGIRLTAARTGPPIPFTIGYEIGRYELSTGEESLQQSFQFGLFAPLSRTTMLHASYDRRFGDDQDSNTFTLSLNQRF